MFRPILHALALAALAAGALPAAPAAACAIPSNVATLRAQMLAETNRQRAAANLPALRRHAWLERAAQAQACDNARRETLSHVDAQGRGLLTRVQATGYRPTYLNENLAQHPGGAASVVRFWMTSPPHRANIRAAQIRDFGGGVARGASGRFYWAMIGGRRG